MAQTTDQSATGQAPRAASPAEADTRSLSTLIGDAFGEMQTILRKELELARQELMAALSVRVQALAAAAVGGLLGLYFLAFAGVTAAKALDLVLPEWAAWLIVTGVFGLIALALFLIARSRATAVPMEPEQTKRSIEENVEWAKHQLKR